MKIFFNILVISALFQIISCEKNPAGIETAQYTWEFSNPAEQGMDPTVLDSAVIQAQLAGFVDGLLVIRNRYIIAEKYFNGYENNSPHNVMSVSKSFLSAITGLALQKGYLDSLNERMLDYFPEYIYPGMDERKYQITIRHLLTMRMGIENETENYFEIYNSGNWIKTTIEWPLLSAPGERMRYNTFQTHLLSAILTKASQMSTLELAKKLLTNPMGVTIDAWEQDPQGYYFGGNSMFFTPREMAVLGYLYLNNGRLKDVQIVPQEWVEFTLTPSTNSPPNAWGAFKNYNYAYLWWLGQIYQYDLFLAYGYGGQFVACFPDLNLIIVSTANNQVDWDTSTLQEWATFDIMEKYILPAVTV
jgi:CubicO group peptidase (beta-lactamase class C family)